MLIMTFCRRALLKIHCAPSYNHMATQNYLLSAVWNVDKHTRHGQSCELTEKRAINIWRSL